MKEILVLTFLGVNAWMDLKKKQVSLAVIGIFSAAGLIWAICTGKISWQFFIPAVIGTFFLLISIMTKGALGMGDGWIMMALGTVLNVEEFLLMLFAGMLCCAVWAGILLIVFRKGKNTEIPFVPFLLLGYIGGVLVWR